MVISLNFVNPDFGFLPFVSLNVMAKDMFTGLVTHPISYEGKILIKLYMYVSQIPQSIYGVMVCVWLQPRHDLIQVYLKPLFKPIHFSLKYTGF